MSAKAYGGGEGVGGAGALTAFEMAVNLELQRLNCRDDYRFGRPKAGV